MEVIGTIQLPSGLGLALLIILIAIAVDTLLGIFISLKEKTFDWGKLCKFFVSGVLPYIGGILILALAAQLVNLYFMELFFAVGSIIVIKYGGEIIIKIQTLFGIMKFPT